MGSGGLKYTHIHHLSIFVDLVFELIFIELQPPNLSKFIFGSVYRQGNNPMLIGPEPFFAISDFF